MHKKSRPSSCSATNLAISRHCPRLRSSLLHMPQIKPGFRHDHAGQPQQGDQIRERHEPVHDIREQVDRLQLDERACRDQFHAPVTLSFFSSPHLFINSTNVALLRPICSSTPTNAALLRPTCSSTPPMLLYSAPSVHLLPPMLHLLPPLCSSTPPMLLYSLRSVHLLHQCCFTPPTCSSTPPMLLYSSVHLFIYSNNAAFPLPTCLSTPLMLLFLSPPVHQLHQCCFTPPSTCSSTPTMLQKYSNFIDTTL